MMRHGGFPQSTNNLQMDKINPKKDHKKPKINQSPKTRGSEVQEKVYEEISRVTEENDGLINHETTNQMPYLEATIEEDLRIHPPVLSLDRECSKDTKIGDLMIKKGVNVLFPIWALHHSEDFFQDPEEFRPERFLKETKEDFHPYAYLPFVNEGQDNGSHPIISIFEPPRSC